MHLKVSIKPHVHKKIHEFLINMTFTMACPNFKKGLEMAFGPLRVILPKWILKNLYSISIWIFELKKKPNFLFYYICKFYIYYCRIVIFANFINMDDSYPSYRFSLYFVLAKKNGDYEYILWLIFYIKIMNLFNWMSK